MNSLLQSISFLAIAHALIVILTIGRVIMKRPSTGSALAWILLVVLVPFAGALIYFLIGERRIGHGRAAGIAKLRSDFRAVSDSTVREDLLKVDWSRHPPAAPGMNRLGKQTTGSSTVRGSSFQMFSDTQEILQAIIRDVDGAKKSVLMEFYIWNEGGTADDVLEAVIRAAGRGVSCRLLVDALGAVSVNGSMPWSVWRAPSWHLSQPPWSVTGSSKGKVSQ